MAIVVVFTWTTVVGESYALSQVVTDPLPVDVDTSNPSEFPFDIPSELGSIKDVHLSLTKNSHFVIHIQDAHANPEAQLRIRDLIQWFSRHPKVSSEQSPLFIGVEGSVGSIHPEYADLFPEFPRVNDAFVRDLHEKGELSGAELFAWEEYKKEKSEPQSRTKVVGVEDAELYRSNIKNYRELISRRDDINRSLAEW